MDRMSLDSLAADFTDAVTIANEAGAASGPQETDLDAVMPPLPSTSTKPDFVPSLQLGLEDDEEDADRFGRSPRSMPPPLLLLMRQRRRRRCPRFGSQSSLPCSPRLFVPVTPSSSSSSARFLLKSTGLLTFRGGLSDRTTVSDSGGSCRATAKSDDIGRIRSLVERVNAMQKSLDTMERRRRRAWEARQLLVDSQDLRRSVDELLKEATTGGSHIGASSIGRPRQHRYAHYGGFYPRSYLHRDALSSTFSSPRCVGGSSSSGSAIEFLNRLVKIRRDVVRRSSASLLLLSAVDSGGCVCGFGVLACR